MRRRVGSVRSVASPEPSVLCRGGQALRRVFSLGLGDRAGVLPVQVHAVDLAGGDGLSVPIVGDDPVDELIQDVVLLRGVSVRAAPCTKPSPRVVRERNGPAFEIGFDRRRQLEAGLGECGGELLG